jgi:hypothetical protein
MDTIERHDDSENLGYGFGKGEKGKGDDVPLSSFIRISR